MQLEREYNYYLKNKADLNAKYNGKYIVIKGEEVRGSYDSEIKAYEDGKEKFGLGNFLIQFCSKESTEPQVFHSRVIIE